MSNAIEITTQYGAMTHEPRVLLKWGPMTGALSPAEAQEHALSILRAAEAATSDALLMRFLETELKVPLDRACVILMRFRELRQKMEAQP